MRSTVTTIDEVSSVPRFNPGSFTGVVAIDGPSGTGKSSVSRRLATRLGARFLDTGSMYRALTCAVLERATSGEIDRGTVLSALDTVRLDVGTDPLAPSIHVDGEQVDALIRTPAVDAAVSAVSAIPEVRSALIAQQRAIIGEGGIVVEGRDITTVVVPTADVRVLLTASAEVRASRRGRQTGTDAAAHAAALARRDSLDSRTSQFVDAAPGVTVLDTSELTQDEVVDRLYAMVSAVQQSVAQAPAAIDQAPLDQAPVPTSTC
jgi:cytidylate kinase